MPGQKRDCRPCEIAWAVLGLIAAGALFYMAADILWDVPLPAWVTGGARHLASVSPIHDGDEAGSGD